MQTLRKPDIIEPRPEQETEGQGIPFHLVREVFFFCQYATTCSVGIKLLHYTGSRISELDNMYKENLHGNWLYWKTGKNQTGWRKEYLPDCFLEELTTHWKKNKTDTHILSVSSETFTRYFRKMVRPFLSSEWRRKKLVMEKGFLKEDYKYLLKGFRKNFATLLFCFFWRKYNDAGVAVERVSKRMQHSSRHMTVNHYIETAEQIEADKYINLMPFEIIDNVIQSRLTDWI